MTIAIRMQPHEWTAVLRAAETLLDAHENEGTCGWMSTDTTPNACPLADLVQARGTIETALLDQGYRRAIVREHVRGREVTR